MMWQEPDGAGEHHVSHVYWASRDCANTGAAGQCNGDFVNGGL